MNPNALTPKQIGHLLDMLAQIEKIGEAVRARAIELAHAGTDIPGYEPCMSNAKRLWTSDEQASTLLGELGLTKEQRYKLTLLSPAQAEKELRAVQKWPKKPRGSAAEDFTNPFEGALSYTDTKPSIRKQTG